MPDMIEETWPTPRRPVRMSTPSQPVPPVSRSLKCGGPAAELILNHEKLAPFSQTFTVPAGFQKSIPPDEAVILRRPAAAKPRLSTSSKYIPLSLSDAIATEGAAALPGATRTLWRLTSDRHLALTGEGLVSNTCQADPGASDSA